MSPLSPLALLERSIVGALILALAVAGLPAEAFAAPQTAAPAAGPVDTSPATLDHLLAPIALYPDALLMQILAASVNTQEVLDAGNWLLENKSLQGTQIDDAAKKLGFGPATTALLHFPEVVDQMCTNIDWTGDVGAAFNANQGAVLDSIQRLRAQAKQAGNLKTTPQQQVETQTDNGKQVIVIQPANPQVIYVPQYNPQTVYVQSGPSAGDVVAASVISFGVGMAVGAIFANNNNYYYPRWGYGGVYYGGRPYARYPYRPAYPGYRPAYGYRPPANYPYHRNNNNNNWNNYRGGNNNRNVYRGGNNTVNIGSGNNNNNNRPGGGYNGNNNRPNNGNNNRPNGGNNNNANNRPNGGNNANNNRPGNGTSSGNRPGNGGSNSRPAPDRGYGQSGNRATQQPQQRPAGGQQQRPAGGQQQRPASAQQRPAGGGGGGGQQRQSALASGGGSGRSANAASQRGAASSGGRSGGGGGNRSGGRN